MCLSAVLGIGSALMGSSSAKKAANAQTAAAAEQTAVQREIYDDQKALYEPYRAAGTNALDAMLYEMGLGPAPTVGGTAPQITTITGAPVAQQPGNRLGNGSFGQRERENGPVPMAQARARAQAQAQAQAQPVTRYGVGDQTFDSMDAAQAYANANRSGGTPYQGYTQSPGYQFQFNEGINAIDRSASNAGGLFSGETMKSALGYGQGLAAQDYGTYYNRLSGLASNGMNAVGGQAAAGQNYATGTSNALANRGNAQAAGATGVGNALQAGLGNGIGIWQYQQGLTQPSSQQAGVFDAPWGSSGFWG
jgi:hypothetical protein